MKFLFIHQNFPGQYLHVVRHLHRTGHTVKFVTQRRDREIEGLETLEYMPLPVSTGVQPYLLDLETNTMNGLAVARLCEGLKRDGFTPDIVVGHTGWGELLFVKDVWPDVPLLGYFEFFYRPRDSDVDFDPEFPPNAEDAHARPHAQRLEPVEPARRRLGTDPDQLSARRVSGRVSPRASASSTRGSTPTTCGPTRRRGCGCAAGVTLSRDDQVLTYSARNLEPYRGFHVFMRALPEVLEALPECPGHHHRRRRRQLRPAARTGRQLARTHAGRARRPARPGPGAFCRLAALRAVSGGAADLGRACLSDLSVRAVVGPARGDGGRVPRHRLAHRAGRGSDRRHQQRLPRRFLRYRGDGGADLRRARRPGGGRGHPPQRTAHGRRAV